VQSVCFMVRILCLFLGCYQLYMLFRLVMWEDYAQRNGREGNRCGLFQVGLPLEYSLWMARTGQNTFEASRLLFYGCNSKAQPNSHVVRYQVKSEAGPPPCNTLPITLESRLPSLLGRCSPHLRRVVQMQTCCIYEQDVRSFSNVVVRVAFYM
jgi:hypothetical protein